MNGAYSSARRYIPVCFPMVSLLRAVKVRTGKVREVGSKE